MFIYEEWCQFVKLFGHEYHLIDRPVEEACHYKVVYVWKRLQRVQCAPHLLAVVLCDHLLCEHFEGAAVGLNALELLGMLVLFEKHADVVEGCLRRRLHHLYGLGHVA